MEAGAGGFPLDWLADVGRPASDVELALLLVNSMDLLEDPPDRLTDLRWLTGAFTRAGHGDLADELTPGDLPRLRALRDALRGVFEAEDLQAAVAQLNPLLERARPTHQLVVDPEASAVTLEVGVGLRGIAALEARLSTALATYVVEHGIARLGVCGSDPCRCVFVDRTRGTTRRYCCTYCNDRYAARAYRRRKRS